MTLTAVMNRIFSPAAAPPIDPAEEKRKERAARERRKAYEVRRERTLELYRLTRVSLVALLALYGAVALASVPHGLTPLAVVAGLLGALGLGLYVFLRGDLGWLGERVQRIK